MLRVALAALLLAPATAQADTIVFQREGDVYAIRPDGGIPRLVAAGGYAWPSQADDGTIVAVDEAGTLHRMTARGAPIGAPLPTPATNPPEDTAVEPPTHARLSPDGTRIAYDVRTNGEATTVWTPANATGIDFPGQGDGLQDLVAPSWIGSDRLLLSRDVAALGGTTFARYTVGGTAEDWFSSDQASWASSFEGASSRDGRQLAELADDGPENAGIPTRVVLRRYTDQRVACDLELPPTETVEHTSPSFSPDGTSLAWAEADGIHVSSGCGKAETVIAGPGATEPYWSGASEAIDKLTLRLAVAAHGRLVRARVTCSAACAVKVTLRRRGRVLAVVRRRLPAAGTVRVRFRRPAHRVTVRASAPGAAPVSRVIRAR